MKHYYAWPLLIISLAYTPKLYAETATTTFTVSASVADNCSVSANSLDFGAYDPIAGSTLDNTTTVGVTCTSGTGYSVGLDAGLGSGATVTTRLMTRTVGGSETLQYSLYRDSGHTMVWGNDDGNWVTGTGIGSTQNLTVYGRIFGSQPTVPVASYEDTITVTVTY